MESKPSTSSSNTPSDKVAITPELLEAMTQQFLTLQKATNQIHKPKIYTFGNITLKALPSQQSFKLKSTVTEEQQVLIDYGWNARSKAQSTVAFQALGAYFQEQNTIKKSLSLNSMAEKTFQPEPVIGNNKLIAALKELEVENAYLQREAAKVKSLSEEITKLKEYILQEEEVNRDAWGRWRRFPHQISIRKEEIMDIVLSDKMAEQICLQQLFRKLACQSQLFQGLTFLCETYEDDGASCKGFSYLTCSVNLNCWKDRTLEGEKITIERLLQFGVVSRLILTDKAQLKSISGLEKLMITLAGMYEKNSKGWFEVNFQTIPPSFYPKHLDDAWSIITITEVEAARQNYTKIPEASWIPEDSVDILDQINMYRAMMYRKPYIPSPELSLITEDRNTKIYGPRYFTNMSVRMSFTGQTTEHPDEVIYFSKGRAFQLTKVEGDVFLTEGSDEEVGSNNLSDNIDSIGMQNIDNAMEG